MDVRRRQEGAAPRLAELGQVLQPEIGWAALTRREGVRKSQQGLAEFIERPAKQAQSSCSNIGVIGRVQQIAPKAAQVLGQAPGGTLFVERSEEHTSELQSQSNLVCRLLLEKKKKTRDTRLTT